MEAQIDTLCLLTQPKEGQQFKNKKQTELKTIELYDNPGDKEEPVIQTGRRGGEDSWQGGSWQTQEGGGL